MKKAPLLLTALLIVFSPLTHAQNPWGRVVDSLQILTPRLTPQNGEPPIYWRIPAVAVMPDSSLLLTIDRRKNSESDLPEDIDILALRSTDGGRMWSGGVLAQGNGKKQGFGDAALVVTESGKVVSAFVGGNGLWASTPDDPDRSYVDLSLNNGKSWLPRQDITSVVWGEKSGLKDYIGGFFASGNGLRIQNGKYKGRILFAAALRKKNTWRLDNYVVYSDDEGENWKVSKMAYEGGDEAKLIQLPDGDILISVRQSGARGWNLSHDGGESWEKQSRWEDLRSNACNGDMLFCKGLLLHSVPNSMERENVSIFASRDNGHSWGEPLLVAPGKSVYSSMCVLPDGRILMAVERNPHGACEIWLYWIEVF